MTSNYLFPCLAVPALIVIGAVAMRDPTQGMMRFGVETTVSVRHFRADHRDSTVSSIAITAERKTIEAFASCGVVVISPLINGKPAHRPSYQIDGDAFRRGREITVAVSLSGTDGKPLTADQGSSS
jgi:hypothetical protein